MEPVVAGGAVALADRCRDTSGCLQAAELLLQLHDERVLADRSCDVGGTGRVERRRGTNDVDAQNLSSDNEWTAVVTVDVAVVVPLVTSHRQPSPSVASPVLFLPPSSSSPCGVVTLQLIRRPSACGGNRASAESQL